MWTTTNFKTYKKQFDFSSSEQGKATYTALAVDDTEFINMVEGLEGEIEEDQIFQSIICDQCGVVHCESGNWIALRQVGDFVFFIPAFEKIAEDIDRSEYEPPYYLKKKGAYWLTTQDYENLIKLVPALKELKTINTLSLKELVSLYKWDTPHKMFGDFPDFRPLRTNHILTVSESDNENISNIIEQKLLELERATNFSLKLLDNNDKIVTVYLDDKETTEWKALCKTGDTLELLLGGTFKLTTK